jgi:hypothetical protein
MKKRLLTTFAATLSLFMSQCSEFPTQKETADGSKSIKIEIKTAPGFDTIAAKAYVQVSAVDMKSTIQQKLTISKDWISGVVRKIPVGYNRHFEVFVQGFDSTTLYYGDTTASIYSGKETYVTIILRKPGGTAIINGYIEEYHPPQDTIPAPGTPYIYSYDIAPTTPPRCSQITLYTDGSKYPDSLLYIWRTDYIANFDTFTTVDTTGMAYFINYPKDGMYQIHVRAMSMYDSTIISSNSYGLIFNIKNGLLADTILPDTVPPVIHLNGPDSVYLKLNSSYIEQGAKAYDNVDGDLTKMIKISGYVDSSKVGIYYIKYYVADKAANSSTAIRIVYVHANAIIDTIAPVITLRGPSMVELGLDDVYLEPGYSAYDNIDGDITSRVKFFSTKDSTNSNQTRITYTVVDKSGNSCTAVRILIRKVFPLATPSMPTIISSKFNGKEMSISLQTSVIDPTSLSSTPVYYDWSIFVSDSQSTSITTTKNTVTHTFKNNTTYSVLVMARYLKELSHVSQVLQFSVLNGQVVYPNVMKVLD